MKRSFGSQSTSGASARSSSISSDFWNSFSFSHSGIAMRNEREAPRREREIGLEQPLELQERLVVEGDEVDVAPRDAGLRAGNSAARSRESRVVLLAGEALFLRGGDDLAVAHERGGAVVIERRDPERRSVIRTSV